jgi:hypothetical protein
MSKTNIGLKRKHTQQTAYSRVPPFHVKNKRRNKVGGKFIQGQRSTLHQYAFIEARGTTQYGRATRLPHAPAGTCLDVLVSRAHSKLFATGKTSELF